MFFIFSKILSFVLQPLIWVFALILFAFFTKNSRLKKRLFLSATIVLFLFSNTFFFNLVSDHWEVTVTDPNTITEQYDIAIVLGGIVSNDEENNLIRFASNSDRFLGVLPLYFDGRVKKILISGGSGKLSQDEVEAEVLAEYLTQIGVKPDDLILEKKSRNTYENALYSADIIKRNFQAKKILLSTSSTHMRRAKACFEKQQLDCTVFSVDEVSTSSDFKIRDMLLPDPTVLNKWYWLLHELVGYVSYKLKGYC